MRIIKFMVLLVVLGGNAAAQTFELPSCPSPGDDRFWFGGCCTTPSATFDSPRLGEEDGIGMTAQWASITDCGVAVEEELEITIRMRSTVPAPLPPNANIGMIACDDVLFQITGANSGGTLAFTIGNSLTAPGRLNWLLGKYIRTWQANDPNGDPVQYYRYLIGGDANFSTPLHPLVPSCEPMFSQVMMHGYIDLSCRHGTPGSEDPPVPPTPPILTASLVLTHYDGCQSHLDTPLNARKLTGTPPNKHVGTTFHLVAPNDFDFSAPLLNPFTDLNITNGTLDAIRSTVSRTTTQRVGGAAPFPGTFGIGPQCLTESPVMNVNVVHDYVDCLCSQIQISPRYYHQSIGGDTNCTTVTPWAAFAVVPEIPKGFFQYHLGMWRATARFDVREVYPLPNLGTIAYLDQCDTAPAEWWHVTYGINTYYSQDHSDLNPNHNLPRLFVNNVPSLLTDTLMDFGNAVNDIDQIIVGTPAYTNILWMVSRTLP